MKSNIILKKKKKGCYSCNLRDKYTCLSRVRTQNDEILFCRNVTTGVLLYCTCNWLVSSLAGQCSEDVLGMQSSLLVAVAFF